MGEHTRETNWRRRGLISVGVLTGLAVALWSINLVRASQACAAVPDPEQTGSALVYGGHVDGNCSLTGATRGELFASVSTREYEGSLACGSYLEVKGPRGTARVQVIDRCPGCREGQLDLNQAAFARIGDPTKGLAEVRYRQVLDPKPVRPLAFRVKAGSTTGWAAVQVIDHGNPLRSVELRDGKDWRGLRRGYDNYWVTTSGAGDRFDVRVTDVQGRTSTAKGLHLSPGHIQKTKLKLYGSTPKPTPTPTPTPTSTPTPDPLTAPEHTPLPPTPKSSC